MGDTEIKKADPVFSLNSGDAGVKPEGASKIVSPVERLPRHTARVEKSKAKLHNRACRMLGIDPAKVKLVGPAEFREIAKCGVSRNAGIIDYETRTYYVRRGEGLSVYLHELLHLLFRHKPHWWIFASAWKLRGMRGTENSTLGARYGYGQGYYIGISKIADVPSRAKLLNLSRQVARRKGIAITQESKENEKWQVQSR